MHEYDRSSKWLIEHYGAALLRLGGVTGVTAWRPLHAEVVQPRQLPDGLLEVQLAGRAEPVLFLIEIYTYPDRRNLTDLARDLMLVYLDRGVLPELLVLVLRPRGQVSLAGPFGVTGPLGWSSLHGRWRTVELWQLPAADLLAAGEVGLIPWVPLTHYEGLPEVLLQRCRERIDQQSPPEHRANFLAVAQVLAGLVYNDRTLLTIFGGKRAMIESPVLDELKAEIEQETMQRAILISLETHYGAVPGEVAAAIRTVRDDHTLQELLRAALRCPDLDTFRLELGPVGPG